MTNKIYKHPGQDQMQVEVILASRPKGQKESKVIYTIRMRYPRIIHSELMTHRVFGRNARSSRAVPFRTMMAELRSTPFVPWHWGKNQSGMQAEEEHNAPVDISEFLDGLVYSREAAWSEACESAIDIACAFSRAGYHKQVVNRLIEPFSWIDVLVTATDWENFLWLRDHKDAEPHLQDLARLVGRAIKEAEVQELEIHKDWHMPYIREADYEAARNIITNNGVLRKNPTDQEVINLLLKISAARCARISYAPFDGDASYEKEIERYNLLVSSDRVHASPLEHQATPDRITGQTNYGEAFGVGAKSVNTWMHPHLHGNLDGYIQARKLVNGEIYNG